MRSSYKYAIVFDDVNLPTKYFNDLEELSLGIYWARKGKVKFKIVYFGGNYIEWGKIEKNLDNKKKIK